MGDNGRMKLLLSFLAAAALLLAAETRLGKPLTMKKSVTIADVFAHPDQYVGKTVQVQGKIAAVCEEMGCWMDLTNVDGQKIHVDVEHGVVVIPKEASGRQAIAEGKLSKTEDNKYTIEGSGVVVMSE
jgi:hypothetical protein